MLHNNTIISSPPERLLLSNYANVARSLLKSYFLKEKTTPSDVANYSKQAIYLINYIDEALDNNRKLNPLQRIRLQEIAGMLTLFESSLIVTMLEKSARIPLVTESLKVAC